MNKAQQGIYPFRFDQKTPCIYVVSSNKSKNDTDDSGKTSRYFSVTDEQRLNVLNDTGKQSAPVKTAIEHEVIPLESFHTPQKKVKKEHLCLEYPSNTPMGSKVLTPSTTDIESGLKYIYTNTCDVYTKSFIANNSNLGEFSLYHKDGNGTNHKKQNSVIKQLNFDEKELALDLPYQDAEVKDIKKYVHVEEQNNNINSKRKRSQLQVMGDSAKNVFDNYKQENCQIDSNNKVITSKKNNKKSLVKFEWRHVIPHSVLGDKSQQRDNLYVGTNHSNSYDLCVEVAVFKRLHKQEGFNLLVQIKEDFIDGSQIGISRRYRILNKVNGKTLDFCYSSLIKKCPTMSSQQIIYKYIHEALK